MKKDREAPREAEMRLGVLGRPHGVRGDLHLRLDNPDSDALEALPALRAETPDGERVLVVKRADVRPKAVVCHFEGIDSREAAQALVGSIVYVRRADLPPLDDDEYYLADLVGCQVWHGENSLGIVVAVRPDPSVDTMIIELEGKLAEQPIVSHWVRNVDIQGRRVELETTDGLIEP